MLTICQALNWAIGKLRQAKIKSAVLDAEILLCHVLNKPLLNFPLRKGREANKSLLLTKERVRERLFIDRAFLYTHFEKIISRKQLSEFKKYIKRRVMGEPMAYILGDKEFYGLKFLVNKNVLIPRPETEMMVEETIDHIRRDAINRVSTDVKKIILIDMGTGSGCIPITIAKRFMNYDLRFKRFKIIATDISDKALAVARKNAKLHGVDKKIKFIKSDLLKNIHKSLFLNHKSIILIANLPYLSESIYQKNYQNLKFEPQQALLAGKDGLKYYRKLLKQIAGGHSEPCILRERRISTQSKRDPSTTLGMTKKRMTIFLEINPNQKVGISKIIKENLPAAEIEFKKDLSKRVRMVKIKI